MDNIARLICHPDRQQDAVDHIEVSGERGHSGFITIRYRLVGDIARIEVPQSAPAGRRDGLWKETCFELFTRDEGDEHYREFNFSPSGAWAAYGFTGYRDGMHDIDIWAPKIVTSVDSGELTVDVSFLSPRLGRQRVGVSAVVKEKDDGMSYWALAHAPGKPDFHHPACFAYELPAPDGI